MGLPHVPAGRLLGSQGLLYRFIINPWSADIFLCETIGIKGFFQFLIIINVLVSSFHFIWIPILWVYGLYKYFYSYGMGIDFRRQNLTSTDVRFWHLKSIPAL